MEPWWEAVCLALGAARVTTVEYNRLTYDHPHIIAVQPASLPLQSTFDAILSISSFDHDGLGRYGDPLAPDGDLLSMDAMKLLLRPVGVLVLTVPIGPDLLVWNLHRRYGPLRLPKLLEGWVRLRTFGWNATRLYSAASFRHSYEPVFVLSPS